MTWTDRIDRKIGSELANNKPTETRTDTRSRLLTEAARQFAEFGYEGASMRKIAAAVGIKAGSIFHHFPDGKEQLYRTIYMEMLAEILVRQSDWISAGDAPADVILGIVTGSWEYFASHPTYASLILRELLQADGEPSEFEDQGQFIVAQIRQYIETAQQQGQLSQFSVNPFIHQATVRVLAFFGAPGLRRALWPNPEISEAEGREQFLADMKAYLSA